MESHFLYGGVRSGMVRFGLSNFVRLGKGRYGMSLLFGRVWFGLSHLLEK